jgi:glucokinase
MPNGGCVLALDVGGTTIKAGIADVSGSFVHRMRRDTRRSAGVKAVVDNLTAVAEELAGVARDLGFYSLAAGVVVPGIVDEERGIAIDASNIGWHDVPLRTLLQERLGLPVYLGHDVRAGALAEARRGAARGHRTFAFLPIGTGIGGAWVIDGRPLAGPTTPRQKWDTSSSDPAAIGASAAGSVASRHSHRHRPSRVGTALSADRKSPVPPTWPNW